MIHRINISGIGLLILLLGFAPIHPLWADSSKAQLAALMSQIKNSPDDQELRKKIIKWVSTMPSKPETPEELDVLMGKAKAILGDAKSPGDNKQAVDTLKQASLLAPWLADPYYNLGVAQQKAEEPLDAIQSFNLYLFAKPHAKDRKSVMERIGSLEYAAEKAQKESNEYEYLSGKWNEKDVSAGQEMNHDFKFIKTGNLIQGLHEYNGAWYEDLRGTISEDGSVKWVRDGLLDNGINCAADIGFQPVSLTFNADKTEITYQCYGHTVNDCDHPSQWYATRTLTK